MALLDVVGVLVLILVAVTYAHDYFSEDKHGEYSPEAAKNAYVDGEISLAEMERRLDLALDEQAAEVRESVERVNGIGPDTSAAIAAEFSSLSELQEASRDELEEINGIGGSRADAVLEYLSEGHS
jgi:ERCC4-type nuclease